MKISESFIKDIIESEFPDNYQLVYDNSNLIQYLDKKMGAVHGDSKKRRSLANGNSNEYNKDFTATI